MQEREDAWFWLFNDKGDFIVKSGYRKLEGEENNQDASFWMRVRKVKLPGKIINFVW